MLKKNQDLNLNLNLLSETQKKLEEIELSLKASVQKANYRQAFKPQSLSFFKTILLQKLFPTIHSLFFYCS